MQNKTQKPLKKNKYLLAFEQPLTERNFPFSTNSNVFVNIFKNICAFELLFDG